MPVFAARQLLLGLLSFVLVGRADAQDSGGDRRPSLGLSSVGAVTVHAGWATVEHDIGALEAGMSLDMGHFSSDRLRLLADVSFLRSFRFTERVETEGRTYRSLFYDLSGHVAVAAHLNSPRRRLSPYVSGGLGVHALTSSFGSLAIDTRYNTNNFGFLVAGGTRLRLGGARPRAVVLEVRRVQAKDVSRLSVHLGGSVLFNDLARR